MGEIKYIRGDATAPSAKGVKLIAHVCNDIGGWGRGFVVSVSRRRPEPEAAYRAWHRGRASNDFGLGVPVRYEAIDEALGRLADKAVELGASVYMPRIGCGLAGGKWSRVEPLIIERLVDRDLFVTVHDHGEH
ncbi:macro domain-containing protein [Streptomyces sviceus]|uniref:Appr-1-p processing protein n=1 Tax=Streptomyces sviceus TaxID=285530 RepID=UPI0036E972DD